jgi:acetyltransferase-like isoleucine patch superfamily enzyme
MTNPARSAEGRARFENVPANTMAAGMPARVVKTL